MSGRLVALLAALHARGVHAAVLAGVVMMPTVIAAGFLSDRAPKPTGMAQAAPISLRGSFDAMDATAPATTPRS